MVSRRRLLLAELAVQSGRPRFWGACVRNAVPVVGVFAFGWSAFLAVSYFIVETWLFLSFIMAAEIAVDPKYDGDPGLAGQWLVKDILAKFLVCAPLTALLLGMCTFPLILVSLAAEQHERTLIGALSAVRAFDIGVALFALFVTLLIEAYGVARRINSASPMRQADDLRLVSMMLRVVCMIFSAVLCFFLQLLIVTGYVGRILVVLVALTSVWIEGLPHHATRSLGVLPKARRTLFNRVRALRLAP